MSESVAAILAHADVARLAAAIAARPGRTVDPQGNEKFAAIAVILRSGAEGHPELLMIKRPEHQGDPWSGHVACPGGRMDSTDRDLEETAVRETLEEIGIDLRAHGRVLGTLDDIAPRIPTLPPLVIRPYVAVLDPSVPIVPNAEVAAAFWVPLRALVDPTSWGSATIEIRGRGSRDVDVFRYEGHLVWGLTERVLRDLLEKMSSTS